MCVCVCVMLLAQISQTLSRHPSLSFITSGRSSKLHLCPYRTVVDKF